MEIRNPTPVELSDLTAQISRVFGYHESEASIARDFPQLYHPSNSRNLWIAAEGATLLAHAGIYTSVLKVEGYAMPVAAIGGVYTNDEFRGQGLASQLVNKCLEEARKSGAALALLWSDKHDFYARLGFHLAGRQWNLTLDPAMAPRLREQAEKCGVPAGALRISDGDVSPEFLAQSFALLNEYPIGPSRTAAEHSLYLVGGSCRVIAAWVGPQLAAYFVIGKGKDLGGYVHEWGGIEGALHHLAATCLESFEQPLSVLSPQFMPEEVSWIYSLEKIGVPFRPEYLALVRVLDIVKLQKCVAAFLTRMGLEEGALRFSQEGEEYVVRWKAEPPLRMNEEQLLRLLFGPELPDHGEMKAFLPMRLWFWGMDSV